MKKILVIDDEVHALSFIKITLNRAGHEVTLAEDGEEGMKCFDMKDFDLVITDILMPGKGGIETIKQIRKSGKAIPILAISGAGSNGAMNYLSIAEMVGASRTLAKPFEKLALLGIVNECMALQAV